MNKKLTVQVVVHMYSLIIAGDLEHFWIGVGGGEGVQGWLLQLIYSVLSYMCGYIIIMNCMPQGRRRGVRCTVRATAKANRRLICLSPAHPKRYKLLASPAITTHR